MNTPSAIGPMLKAMRDRLDGDPVSSGVHPAEQVDPFHASLAHACVRPLMRGDWALAGFQMVRSSERQGREINFYALSEFFRCLGLRATRRSFQLSKIYRIVETLKEAGVKREKLDGVPASYASDVADALESERIGPGGVMHLLKYRRAYGLGRHPEGREMFRMDTPEALSSLLQRAKRCKTLL